MIIYIKYELYLMLIIVEFDLMISFLFYVHFYEYHFLLFLIGLNQAHVENDLDLNHWNP